VDKLCADPFRTRQTGCYASRSISLSTRLSEGDVQEALPPRAAGPHQLVSVSPSATTQLMCAQAGKRAALAAVHPGLRQATFCVLSALIPLPSYLLVYTLVAKDFSQNHRMEGVGSDLCGSSSPTLLPK